MDIVQPAPHLAQEVDFFDGPVDAIGRIGEAARAEAEDG